MPGLGRHEVRGTPRDPYQPRLWNEVFVKKKKGKRNIKVKVGKQGLRRRPSTHVRSLDLAPRTATWVPTHSQEPFYLFPQPQQTEGDRRTQPSRQTLARYLTYLVINLNILLQSQHCHPHFKRPWRERQKTSGHQSAIRGEGRSRTNS